MIILYCICKEIKLKKLNKFEFILKKVIQLHKNQVYNSNMSDNSETPMSQEVPERNLIFFVKLIFL